VSENKALRKIEACGRINDKLREQLRILYNEELCDLYGQTNKVGSSNNAYDCVLVIPFRMSPRKPSVLTEVFVAFLIPFIQKPFSSTNFLIHYSLIISIRHRSIVSTIDIGTK
jgi:hypothetical protein